ncbi:molybdenum ABC transporter substrate-binding protein [Dictyobacter alpinus]|uniref:Molybdenum ABC transporter substrate-binding protein n=1 Tax=Dictyobacter alpinus TaxID=2014873 RepID=A0A402B4K5_9CHLR|nr:molybdate ABC transporter substrate-binding protein [Dictyobacter alpinus]GCE26295.1 molybdenum ABC transporter substrate-binding protein [Dictyobacter alpinus]
MKLFRSALPLLLLVLLIIVSACGESAPAPSSNAPSSPKATPAQVSLKIFAASSLTESFNSLKTSYHNAHPNVDITYNFNGSQALVQQLTNGANADIFASADQTNMQKAAKADVVGESKVFAKNKLVIILPKSNPGHITSLKDLSKSGIKLVVGAPAVPIGKYGLQVLDKMGTSPEYGTNYERSVKANIVSQEQNVKAVVQKVQLGEADAGIVYQTDVTAAVENKLTTLTIPDQFNVIASYPIAITKNSAQATEAQNFLTYLLSPEGQATLAKYHFIGIK